MGIIPVLTKLSNSQKPSGQARAQTFNLQDIQSFFKTAEYNPERFPVLVFRLKRPKTSTLIFNSGKMICTGAKTDTMVHEAVNKLWGTLDDYELFY